MLVRPVLKWPALFLLSAGALAASSAWAVGWFIDFSDQPRKADMIVVLAGEFSRPFYGADLYKQGLAPEVWLSRPCRSPAARKAASIGVNIPLEEDINKAILLRLGVPQARIHLYGDSLMSTANEALALKRATDLRGKTILIVTSRWHARRAKWIFRRTAPEADVLVCATPYEEFSKRWWSRQHLAQAAIM